MKKRTYINPGPAVCQRIHAEGCLGEGVEELAVGGFLRSEQAHLGFPEMIPNQLDHLGMKSPFSRKSKLL